MAEEAEEGNGGLIPNPPTMPKYRHVRHTEPLARLRILP